MDDEAYQDARFDIYCNLLEAAEFMDIPNQPTEGHLQTYIGIQMQTFGVEYPELAVAFTDWLEEVKAKGSMLETFPSSQELRHRIGEIKAARSPEGETDDDRADRLARLAQLNRELKAWVNQQEPPRHDHLTARGMPVRCDDGCPYQAWKISLRQQINERFLTEIDKLSTPSTQLSLCRCDRGMVVVNHGRLEPCSRCRPMQHRHATVCVPRGFNVKNCDCREAMAYGGTQ